MTAEDLRRLVESIRGPLGMRCDFHPTRTEPSQIVVMITIRNEDAERRRSGKIEVAMACAFWEYELGVMSPADAIDRIRRRAFALWTHEFDEFFSVGERRVAEPHPERAGVAAG